MHPLYGHTLSNDGIRESDQKVLRGSGAIREEGIETRRDLAKIHLGCLPCIQTPYPKLGLINHQEIGVALGTT